MFGAVSEENVERIKRQNKRKISVILGNPPYNANQQNESDNNKNRVYRRIDERIKATYIKESTAQKTKLYDMYARFFRWASDRLKDDGIIAFISNRSFIDSRTFDGFRKIVAREFNEIYVLDLGGDVRDNPKLSGTKHNVFGIQIGVAISFLIKRKGDSGCHIRYARRPEMEAAEEKLAFLSTARLSALHLDEVKPDWQQSWINQGFGEFSAFLPLATKAVKDGRLGSGNRSIFRLFSLGVSTNRDEWVYDFNKKILAEKAKCLIASYDSRAKGSEFASPVKWSETLKRRSEAGNREPFREKRIRSAAYRPFFAQWLYASELYIDRPGALASTSPIDATNLSICFSDPTSQKPFVALAVDCICDLLYIW